MKMNTVTIGAENTIRSNIMALSGGQKKLLDKNKDGKPLKYLATILK
jgi:hypothetical protein